MAAVGLWTAHRALEKQLPLEAIFELSKWAGVLSAASVGLLLLSLLGVLVIRMRHGRARGFHGTERAILCAYAVAALATFNVARLPATGELAAIARLAQVGSSLGRKSLVPAPYNAAAVPELVAIVHPDGRITFINKQRILEYDAGSRLPEVGYGLLLLAEDGCSIRLIRELLEQASDDYSILLGRIIDYPRTRFDAFATAEVARTRVAWMSFAVANDPVLGITTLPARDLDDLPDSQLVREVALDHVLVTRRSSDARPAPVPRQQRELSAFSQAFQVYELGIRW